MHVSAAFDSGNVEVLDASDPGAVRLAIRKDHASDFYQWFHFRVSGARDTACVLRLVNAAGAAYPPAWPGYRACASHDRKTWFRVDTEYVDGELVIRHTPSRDVTWYAYFAPYSLEQHQDLLARCQQGPGVTVDRLGATLDGRDLDRVRVGTGPRQVWIIGRQHPGESMAEWWMDGFLERLLDPNDALARDLLRKATFHVVPNMNPDGSVRGHLRTNAAGANLNREWHAPTMERAPEVRLVRDAMDRSGVHLCLDVHGDEELPYNFIAGPDGIPSFDDRIRGQLAAFLAAYMRVNPDFQTAKGYPPEAPGQANLTMCTNQVAERFKCLAMTLEMPFKDTADDPQPHEGWSSGRAARLGRSALDPIAAVLV